ncbi:hypothetical protein J2046_006112 [Rhizobium petrolearium]|nr:hypothetical protein [Neorhizobium petrolearium]
MTRQACRKAGMSKFDNTTITRLDVILASKYPMGTMLVSRGTAPLARLAEMWLNGRLPAGRVSQALQIAATLFRLSSILPHRVAEGLTHLWLDATLTARTPHRAQVKARRPLSCLSARSGFASQDLRARPRSSDIVLLLDQGQAGPSIAW